MIASIFYALGSAVAILYIIYVLSQILGLHNQLTIEISAFSQSGDSSPEADLPQSPENSLPTIIDRSKQNGRVCEH